MELYTRVARYTALEMLLYSDRKIRILGSINESVSALVCSVILDLKTQVSTDVPATLTNYVRDILPCCNRVQWTDPLREVT